jgi:3-deoxy-manno-octulosonate cytidylyltransferase (CMP-KDO synthetase)
VFVATCDDAIAAAAHAFGARVVLTSSAHERATDRVAEAVAADTADIVVMVQGDEPMIEPGMIDVALRPLLRDPALGCANLAAPIHTLEELEDPNTIKVVMDHAGRALFFSRAPIPSVGARGFHGAGWFKQVCVIAFRREALSRFAALPPGVLERAESIDMLRYLEHGIAVQMVHTDVTTHAVDTPDDLRRVSSLMFPGGPALDARSGFGA